MGNRYALEPGVRAMLTDIGLSPTAVFRRAGLRLDLLSDGPVWLAQDEFFSLWRAIEVEANHPNLPILILEMFSPDLFSPSLFAAVASPDLNTAAHRVAQYKRLVGPLHMDIDIGAHQTTLSFEWPAGSHPPDSMVLTELLFWVGLARLGTRADVTPTRVTVPAPPNDLDAYHAAFGVEIEPSDTQCVSFRADDAARPFLTANDAIWETFEPQLRRRLAELDVDASTSERVEAVLLEVLPVGRTTVANVAKELAVSSRTLHRQLKAEGVSFQWILSATREKLARHYLRNPTLSGTDIAFLLGYGDTSSFYRAFQSWTGQTPEQVRSSLAGH
ncbi:MAG: AraC family transcriptional regulator [Deltaproteobacteria bacterium]|nr:AraC family transcriptional regulator [Deltaproteobacteria bacterium]